MDDLGHHNSSTLFNIPNSNSHNSRISSMRIPRVMELQLLCSRISQAIQCSSKLQDFQRSRCNHSRLVSKVSHHLLMLNLPSSKPFKPELHQCLRYPLNSRIKIKTNRQLRRLCNNRNPQVSHRWRIASRARPV